ncbi:TPA: IS4-like element ISLpn4 family transposase, partial [Legionella pneumophila subsp. pneumophila]|nr:IS4-like element ISLpn4 family transposase [Legionella pneumophila subsp. pneumophila]
MDLAIEDSAAWSEAIFGSVDLGDKRLTHRLAQIGKQLTSLPGGSLPESCEGQDALIEGSYRFLRNKRVTASQIAEGGYQVTSWLSQRIPTLLAIEDTTTLSYTHQIKESLGDLGGPKEKSNRGFHVHTTMLMDAEQEKTIGLIAQERWCRDIKERGKKNHRRVRLYTEKESYKWEKNTRELERRLGSKMSDVISVCDREADIFEYIQYKLDNHQRFIVRASHNRKLEGSYGYLFQMLPSATILGTYTIAIAQKANRKKRQAALELKTASVTFSLPERRAKARELKPITLNVVIAKEKNPSESDCLEWVLLTTEATTTLECARKITRYYEMRWRIEDFHKAWKSGVGAEEQRMQSIENLEKMIVILSFVAIRLLQLKEYFEYPTTLVINDSSTSCDELLTDAKWKVLWNSVERKSLPEKIPTAAWAYKAIAKLGGWT